MMEYILDTHTLLWLFFAPENLSEKVASIIKDENNRIHVSIVTFWEIAIKIKIRKISLSGVSLKDVKDECERLNFSILRISFEDVISYLSVPLFKTTATRSTACS